ncbi:THUMP domain-containing class I SAM-dependent RNA methyltransferase [Heyndrickxia ginsengihumi]|uniref:THUMP domain-containing class I SAM-dependent RNA methyltransferase n=1 Tax=Heyndrickxia ginsengihumi TaxID=363870 RepID=UPI003D1BCF85
MGKYTLIATSAMGLEALVAKEVRDLGYDCQVENGKIIFEGDELAIARCNMWLRTADRVKLIVGEFKAFSFDELFEKTKALKWSRFITKKAQFIVNGKSHKSKLFSVSDCQSIVKKAIVESLKKAYKIEWFEESAERVDVEVAILKDVVTLTIDTTGKNQGLHKRGYRVSQGPAPIKETLAAAMISLTNWYPDRPFVDPFCGSGTLPIEAALIGQNIAPGFNREFISETWPWIDQSVWEKARTEAEDMANYDQKLKILGSDIDHKMIEISKQNANEAGLGDIVNFKQMQVTDFTSKEEYGVLLGNPPYGERIGDREEVEQMYREMGKAFQTLDTWSIYILTSYEKFEQLYGKKATKKRKLFNGSIRTDLYQFWGPRPPRK